MIYTCRPTRFGVYVDSAYPCSTAAEVRALTGADAVCNGWLFNMATGASCCNIKVGGRVLSRDPCAYLGYGWDDGKMPEMTLSMDEHDNFISCVALVNYGLPCTMYYGGGLAGRRGRTAIGFKKDGTLVMLCTSDRSGPLTMEELQSRMLEAGCETALALDGGGSSQCDTPAGDIVSSRAVPYFICVWTDDNREESKPMAKYKVCLDAGHGGRESWNGSPDGGYKEHIGVLDIAKRTRDYLEAADGPENRRENGGELGEYIEPPRLPKGGDGGENRVGNEGGRYAHYDGDDEDEGRKMTLIGFGIPLKRTKSANKKITFFLYFLYFLFSFRTDSERGSRGLDASSFVNQAVEKNWVFRWIMCSKKRGNTQAYRFKKSWDLEGNHCGSTLGLILGLALD